MGFSIGVVTSALAQKTKNKKGIIAACAAIAALSTLFIFDAVKNVPGYTKSEIVMGTVVTQDLMGYEAEETAAEIFKSLYNLEFKWLSWRVADSDIAGINVGAGSAFPVADNTANWLKKTLDICSSSAGAFDITIGRLSSLWDIGGENPRLPGQTEIDAVLAGIGYGKVEIDGSTVKIDRGQSLDMGAVGKGIACDEALKILQMSEIRSAVISVGGSILLYGKGKDVRVGIRDPKGDANDYMGVLSLSNTCISTSGSYEKVLTIGDKSYHHILDPKTGYPAQSGLLSVTVVTGSGLVADALSTACFVLGYEKSIPLLNRYKAEAVFIADDYTVMVTPGLDARLEITADGYTRLSAETGS